MFVRLGLYISVSISVLIHLILLLYVPALSTLEMKPITYTEIELRELPPPLPDAKEIQVSSETGSGTTEEATLKETPIYPVNEGENLPPAQEQAALPKEEVSILEPEQDVPPQPLIELAKKAEELVQDKLPASLSNLEKPKNEELLPKGEEFKLSTFKDRPAPSLDVPKTAIDNREDEVFARFSKSIMTRTAPDTIGRNPFPSQSVDMHMTSGLSKITVKEKELPPKPVVTVKKEEPSPSFGRTGILPGRRGENVKEGTMGFPEIKGPVAKRAIVYRPPIPKVNVETRTDIQLKFWVLPDGTVGRVIPIVKGDSRLEAEAVNYMKQWKFAPLPSRDKQEEEWGTIPIKFLLG